MQPITFSEFRSELMRNYRPPLRAKATRDKMLQVLKEVERLGALQTSDLNTDLVTDYIVARSAVVCRNTVRGELAYLRAAVNYAFEEEWLDHVPRWRRIWPRASPPRRRRVHSIVEIGRVLQYLRHRSKDWHEHRTLALASLVAHTGCRRNEALHARVEDFDLVGRIWWITDWAGLKTERAAAPVPLCWDLFWDLSSWLPRTGSAFFLPHRGRSGPWTSGGKGRRPSERLVAAGVACGVRGLNCQALRHAFCTHGRRRWGISRVVMLDLLRHTTEETQRHYLHPEEDLDEFLGSVRRVGYRQPGLWRS